MRPAPITSATIDDIVEQLAWEAERTPASLYGRRNTGMAAELRTAAIWLAYRATSIAIADIAAAFGRRATSIVYEALARADRLRDEDVEFRTLTDRLFANLTVQS